MINVEQEISRVEQLYRQVAGSEPKRPEQPLAPIPPEANAEQYVQENLQRLFGALQAGLAPLAELTPQVALFESDRDWRCLVELPGVAREDLTVQVTQGVLRVAALRPLPAVDGEARSPSYSEIAPCRFVRAIPMPAFARFESAEARLENGILTVRCAKDQAAVRRDVRIEVV
ncbi:MAG: Hsp20/alpha crystallin family protein [Myxococcales bacterium]|nr:Hsp20/alpha crystallin family protein [Myxococcales bacterium]